MDYVHLRIVEPQLAAVFRNVKSEKIRGTNNGKAEDVRRRQLSKKRVYRDIYSLLTCIITYVSEAFANIGGFLHNNFYKAANINTSHTFLICLRNTVNKT